MAAQTQSSGLAGVQWRPVLLISLMFAIVQFGLSVSIASQLRPMEHIICRAYYKNNAPIATQDSGVHENLCKITEIQEVLIEVLGWQSLFENVPGLLLAMPYGVVADKYGRKVVLMASMTGMLLSLVWVLFVCRAELPIRSIWLSNVFVCIGGGGTVAMAISMTIIADATPEKQIIEAFIISQTISRVTFYCEAMSITATFMGAISRINTFCKETIAEQEPKDPQRVSPEWLSQGRITYNDASVTHSAEGSTPVEALQSVSFEIEPGAKVAVYGRTNSVKSSFVLSLAAMVPCISGSIVIDDVDIGSIASEVPRSRLHAVPQDLFILAQTNQTELDPRRELDDVTMINVLERCGIWGKIKENGGLDGNSNIENLSSGEAQLFCVARAILSADSDRDNGGVVILDEATASVGVSTEERIQALIFTMLAKKTVISIKNRLETARYFDKIIVLEQGRLLDFGAPAEVMGRCELFSDLRP